MSEEIIRKENQVLDTDYKWPFGIFKTFFAICFIFTITLVLTFPLKKIFNHFLALAFESQPNCRITYTDYNFSFFMPSLNFEEVTIPERCLSRDQKNMPIDEISLGFGGVNFSPIGIVLNLGTKVQTTNLDLKVASNGKEHVIKISDQTIELEHLTELMKKMSPSALVLKGKAKISLDASIKNNQLENLNALKITSKDFYFPSQAISMLSLPNLDLKKLDINIVGKKEKISIKEFSIGSAESPLQLDVSGNITADYRQMGNSQLNLDNSLRVTETLSSQLPLDMFLGALKTGDGKFDFNVSGTASQPQTKKL